MKMKMKMEGTAAFKIESLMVAIFMCQSAHALPDLKLPVPNGVKVNITRSYDTAPTHIGKDLYAIDFAASGCNSWNQPVVAVADGNVAVAHTTNDNDYGRYVIID